jgi:3'-phosphoadenosine 5'-phosphosulfate sulfotransferase (PAPS reductase)/FAD synthetase
MELLDLIATLPKNKTIVDNFIRAYDIINNKGYKSIMCSISGGSDSDIMLDIIHKVDKDNKVRYVFFDTGLEYKATKEHLNYLENRYNITIQRERAVKPIPIAVKEYGVPFVSKFASYYIGELQKHNFKFNDTPYELLLEQGYPKGMIKWWCNKYPYDNSIYNISYNRYLKDFLISHPPTFKISSQCCDWAKKKVKKNIIDTYKCDLMIVGIRKNEGGIRSAIYKNCYSCNDDKADEYRPLFWYTNEDKEQYTKHFNIKHSDCYEKWGFKRTGCVGCPFNRQLRQDLQTVKQYEPNMYKAVNNIFKDSYEYTKQYRQFVADMKRKEKGYKKLW